MPKKTPPKYLQCSSCGLLGEYDGGSGMYFTKDGQHIGERCPKCGSTAISYPQFEKR